MDNIDKDEEIKKLHVELKALQDSFRQVTEENKHESYDVRRSKVLKAQIIQLERQCMLLSDALSSRSAVLLETENELISLTELLQNTLAQESPGPVVSMSRKQLISHIQTLQKLKGSIQKQAVLSGAENLRIPQLSGIRFCKSDAVSCLDVCSGKTEHLSLQHVAYLENKLVELLHKLTSYQTTLQSVIPASDQPEATELNLKERFSESYLFTPGFKKILLDTKSCIEHLEDCSQDLLALSLLHPSAPWSVTKTPAKFGLFEVSRVLQTLPTNLQRNKDVKSVIASFCKAHSYITHVNDMRLDAVREEVYFCSKISASYAHYMNCLLEGVMVAYGECEKGLTGLIRGPLAEISESWNTLKANQSENNMRQLLSSLKRNEDSLARLVERVSSPSTKDAPKKESGLKVLEEFGLDLKEQIDTLKRQSTKTSSRCEVEIDDYMHRNENDVIERLKNMLHLTA